MVIALFLLVASQLKVEAPDRFWELGQRRATFGERKNPPPEWRIYDMGDQIHTHVIFPEGLADRRYFVGQVPNGHWFLSLQTRHGKEIKLDWYVELDYDKNRGFGGLDLDYRGNASMGSMESYLFGQGLKAKAPTAAVRAVLDARKGFAAYTFQPQTGNLMFYYIAPNGAMVQALNQDDTRTNWPASWPNTNGPYPITTAEKTALSVRKP